VRATEKCQWVAGAIGWKIHNRRQRSLALKGGVIGWVVEDSQPAAAVLGPAATCALRDIRSSSLNTAWSHSFRCSNPILHITAKGREGVTTCRMDEHSADFRSGGIFLSGGFSPEDGLDV
jgi:hypothetical protein